MEPNNRQLNIQNRQLFYVSETDLTRVKKISVMEPCGSFHISPVTGLTRSAARILSFARM